MYEGIEYRGFGQEIVEELAKYSKVPVWNGLTNEYHPTQMLADMLTIQEEFGHLKGINSFTWRRPLQYGKFPDDCICQDGNGFCGLCTEEILPERRACGSV